MSEKQITIVCISILVVILVIAGGVLYYLEYNVRAELQKEIVKLDKEIKTAKDQRAKWPILEAENAKLDALIKAEQVKIPTFYAWAPVIDEKGNERWEMDTFADLLDTLRKSSNVYLSGGVYTPGPPGSPGPFGPLPANVQRIQYQCAVRGGWFNLLRFINMLETQQRRIVVDNISITPGGDSDTLTTTPRRDLNIRVTSFMYREEPAPPEAVPTPTGTEGQPPKEEKKPDVNKSTLPPD